MQQVADPFWSLRDSWVPPPPPAALRSWERDKGGATRALGAAGRAGAQLPEKPGVAVPGPGGIPAGEGLSAQALTALQPGCPRRGMPAPSLPPLLLRRPLAPCAPRSLDGRPGAACSPSIHLDKKLIQKGQGYEAPHLPATCPRLVPRLHISGQGPRVADVSSAWAQFSAASTSTQHPPRLDPHNPEKVRVQCAVRSSHKAQATPPALRLTHSHGYRAPMSTIWASFPWMGSASQ